MPTTPCKYEVKQKIKSQQAKQFCVIQLLLERHCRRLFLFGQMYGKISKMQMMVQMKSVGVEKAIELVDFDAEILTGARPDRVLDGFGGEGVEQLGFRQGRIYVA